VRGKLQTYSNWTGTFQTAAKAVKVDLLREVGPEVIHVHIDPIGGPAFCSCHASSASTGQPLMNMLAFATTGLVGSNFR